MTKVTVINVEAREKFWEAQFLRSIGRYKEAIALADSLHFDEARQLSEVLRKERESYPSMQRYRVIQTII